MQSLAWLKQLGLKLNMTEQIRYANTAQTSLHSNDEFVKFFTRYAARYGSGSYRKPLQSSNSKQSLVLFEFSMEQYVYRFSHKLFSLRTFFTLLVLAEI